MASRSFMAVLLILVALVAPAHASTEIGTCANLTLAGESYVLNQSVGISNLTCFNITAENIMLDCNGSSVTGSHADGTYGIYTNQPNTTIANCNVQNFTAAIFLDNSNYSVIYNSNGLSNSSYGIYLVRSSNCQISNSTGVSLHSDGVYLFIDCNNNTISNLSGTGGDNDDFAGGQRGIGVYSSSYNTFVNPTGIGGNSIDGTGGAGIFFYESRHSRIFSPSGQGGASANSVGGTGIELSANSNNNTITNARGSSSSGKGIALETNSNNTIVNATGSSSTGEGIYLSSSQNNTLNRANGSSDSGNGISLSECSRTSISNSYASSQNGSAFYSYRSGFCNLSSIAASSDSGNALFMNQSSNWSVADSVFTSGNGTPIFIYSSGGNSFGNNTLSTSSGSSALAAISGFSTCNVFFQNNFSNYSGMYINDSTVGRIYPTKALYETAKSTTHGTLYENGLIFGTDTFSYITNAAVWKLNISSGIMSQANITVSDSTYGFSQITYANSTGLIYMVNEKGIYALNPSTLSAAKVVNGSFGSLGSITNDGNYIYTINYNATSQVKKYDISNYSLIATSEDMPSYRGHNIMYADGFLYATSTLGNGKLTKLNASTLAIVANKTYGSLIFTDDMAMVGSLLYLVSESNAIIIIVNSTNLETYHQIDPLDGVTGYYSIFYDGTNIYAGTKEENPDGKIVIINATTHETTIDHMGDYAPNEILSDGENLLHTRWGGTGVVMIKIDDLLHPASSGDSLNRTSEGNIYFNVVSGEVDISGAVPAGGLAGYYLGDSGTGYPYDENTSLGKVSSGLVDYAPLTPYSSSSSASGGGSSPLATPSLSYSFSCQDGALEVLAMHGGDAIPSLPIRFYSAATGAFSFEGTGQDGIAEFAIASSGTYSVDSVQTGSYSAAGIPSFTLLLCTNVSGNQTLPANYTNATGSSQKNQGGTPAVPGGSGAGGEAAQKLEAEAAVKHAEVYIAEAARQGKYVASALNTLAEAQNALARGNYAEAKRLAADAEKEVSDRRISVPDGRAAAQQQSSSEQPSGAGTAQEQPDGSQIGFFVGAAAAFVFLLALALVFGRMARRKTGKEAP